MHNRVRSGTVQHLIEGSLCRVARGIQRSTPQLQLGVASDLKGHFIEGFYGACICKEGNSFSHGLGSRSH